LGYACEIFDNGTLGFEAWSSGRYGLILTDCHMPEMDGYEMTAAIRVQEGLDPLDGLRIPIVAITANALQGEADLCLEVGMDDYLSKPLEMAKLKQTLAKWLPTPEDDGPADEVIVQPLAPPAGDETGPIDTTYLRSVFGNNEVVISEVLRDFVEPATDTLNELDAALMARDPAEIATQAHKLKSACRAQGANIVADLCETLEDAGRATDWDIIADTFPALVEVMADVLEYVEKL
jgi:two-component system sensor histidine kinase/response regulator